MDSKAGAGEISPLEHGGGLPVTPFSRRRRGIAMITGVVGVLAAIAPAAWAAPAVGEALDALVAPHFRADQPGAAVLVRKGDEILLRKGYGLADLERKLPVRPELVFRLASITKQFTAAAVMILADAGKLSVKDDVRKFLPSYPTHGATITIEHLLTHTSGIPGYTEQPGFTKRMAQDIEPAALVEQFKDLPLDFKPGEQMKYSNSGYHLLGLIIEKVSGKTYADFIAERIAKPLGMTHTGYGDDARLPLVRGYERSESGPARPAPFINMKIPYAAGALVSSVDDLARWDAAIAAGKLLAPKSWERVFTPGTLNDGKPTDYGYGWNLGKIDGRRAQRHGGGIPGFSTFILRIPEDKLFVAILCNTVPAPTDTGRLAHRLAMTALGKPLVDPTLAKIDLALLDKYAGVYRTAAPRVVLVRREGDHLTVQPERGPRHEAWPESDTRFFIKDSPVRFAFTRSPAGAVTAIEITKPDGELERAQRTTDKLPTPPAVVTLAPEVLDRYVGEYRLSPDFAITVTRSGAQLYAQATDQPRFDLFASAPGEFFLRVVDARLSFKTKGKAPAHELVLHQNGRSTPGKRVR